MSRRASGDALSWTLTSIILSKTACLGHICHYSSNQYCRIELFLDCRKIQNLRSVPMFFDISMLSCQYGDSIHTYILSINYVYAYFRYNCYQSLLLLLLLLIHHHPTSDPTEFPQGFALTVHGWSPNGALEDSIQSGKMICPSTFQISGLFWLVDKPLIKQSWCNSTCICFSCMFFHQLNTWVCSNHFWHIHLAVVSGDRGLNKNCVFISGANNPRQESRGYMLVL